jgi:hypothetical protein
MSVGVRGKDIRVGQKNGIVEHDIGCDCSQIERPQEQVTQVPGRDSI